MVSPERPFTLTVKDGKVIMDGTITNPEVVAAIRKRMREGMTSGQALEAILLSGIRVMGIEWPLDGQTRHGAGDNG